MILSRRVDTTTFPTILLSTSSTPIGHNPVFLSKGIRRQNRKASKVFARSFSMHSFFIMLAMVVHKSVEISVNCLDIRIFFPTVWIHPEKSRTTFGFQCSFANCICNDILVFELVNTFRLIRKKDFFSYRSRLRMLLF